ncbi:PIN domain-containing protein [Halobacterium zhouii]|uniref:PIN domain-containing protein n=1 Tax=Halobacterium zhouii TaxID=2902624 RepID=UPI001E32C0B8|nr:PIN domain-containing protein [Halobacterium zhouii]
MILDTNFLSHLIDEDQEAWDVARDIHANDVDKKITPVVLFELYYGAVSNGDENLIRRVRNVAKMYDMVPMSDDKVMLGAELLADADSKEGGDCGVGQRDGMIAGVAADEDEPVLTENVSDFEKLDVGLEEF